MNQVYTLLGNRINSISEFHSEIAELFEFPGYYGKNLDALWDCLTGWIDTDIILVWENHSHSRKSLGEEYFSRIIKVLDDLKEEYPEFIYRLE